VVERRGMDESPLSEFIVKMRDAYLRRLAAVSLAEKRAIEREMQGLIRDAGRDADAATAAEPDRDGAVEHSVPRATRRRARPGVPRGRTGRRWPEGFDPKMAQAGDRSDDE